SVHVRNAPKTTVGRQSVVRRDGQNRPPQSVLADGRNGAPRRSATVGSPKSRRYPGGGRVTYTSGALSRRTLLPGLAATPALTAAAAPVAAQTPAAKTAAEQAQAALKDAKATKLVLLGTGGGPGGLGRTRKMTSHVMLSNGAAYVLDCGLGVIDQYARTGIPFPALRSIFITHHHADHNIEYGPLLVVGWIMGMHLDVRAFGPPPLKQMTEDFIRAYKTTVDFGAEDFKVKPLVAVDVKEVSAAGPVTQD